MLGGKFGLMGWRPLGREEWEGKSARRKKKEGEKAEKATKKSGIS